MTSRLPHPAPGTGKDLAPLTDLFKTLGAMSGLTLATNFTTAVRAQLLRRIKQEDLYQAVSPSWEAFCDQHLPISRRTADEDIMLLERLGDEFMAASGELGLGRRQLRALASSPTELLPRADGDEIVIGEERIPLSDKGRVVDLLEQLLAEQEQLTQRIEKGKEQLTAKSHEARELQKELKRIEDVQAGRVTSQADHDFVWALKALRQAADSLSHPDPNERLKPQVVLAYFHAMGPAISEIAHYGGQYVTPEWAQDAEALRRHMDEMVAAQSEVASGWDDEDKLL